MNSPSSSFSSARSLSPCSTRIFTEVWLSLTVVKTWRALVGTVVFCWIELLEVAADDHDAERVRRDVEQQHLLLLVQQRRALDGRAERHHLVGVHALARLHAEELRHLFLDLRHARHAADEDARPRSALRGPWPRPASSRRSSMQRVDQIRRQLLQLARATACDCRWSASLRRCEMMNGRLISTSLEPSQLALRLLGGVLAAAAAPSCPCADRCRARLTKPHDEPVDDARVEVLAAEERIAGRRDRPRTRRCRSRRIGMSNVPPPRSNTATLRSPVPCRSHTRAPRRWAR